MISADAQIGSSLHNGSAIQVVQNLDSSQIETALVNLQQAANATPIGVPVVGAHPSRPQRAQQRASDSLQERHLPIALEPRTATATATPQAMAVSLSSDADHYDPVLSEKWMSTTQLSELSRTQGTFDFFLSTL
jgi:hypothetical protein